MGRPGTGALVSLVERRSRYTLLGKVGSKQAEPVAATTIGLLAPYKQHTQTITADNARSLPTMPPSATRWTRPSILPTGGMISVQENGGMISVSLFALLVGFFDGIFKHLGNGLV